MENNENVNGTVTINAATKDFTRKRVSIYKTIELQPIVKKYIKCTDEMTNILYYIEYLGIRNDNEEFIRLMSLMIDNNNKFADWRKHIDENKTLAEIKKEISVFQDKWNEINDKMDRIAHIDIYTAFCEYPSIKL